MANARMKDCFDHWVLLSEDALDTALLRPAVEATFARRQLPLPNNTPAGLSEAFVQDAAKQKQWAAILKRNRLTVLDLAVVIERLRDDFFRIWAAHEGPNHRSNDSRDLDGTSTGLS